MYKRIYETTLNAEENACKYFVIKCWYPSLGMDGVEVKSERNNDVFEGLKTIKSQDGATEECAVIVRADTIQQALSYCRNHLYEWSSFSKPVVIKRYPMEELSYIEVDLIEQSNNSMTNDDFVEYIEKQGGEIIQWDAHPISDSVSILVRHKNPLKWPSFVVEKDKDIMISMYSKFIQ